MSVPIAGTVADLLKEQLGDLKPALSEPNRVRGGARVGSEGRKALVARRRITNPLDWPPPARARRDGADIRAGPSNASVAEMTVTVPGIKRRVTNMFGKLAPPPGPEDHERALAVLECLKRSNSPVSVHG